MATLLSSSFAVTTSHLVEGLPEVFLHFDLWPNPFAVPARVVAVYPEAELAFLKFESPLGVIEVLLPQLKFANPDKFNEQWESVLLSEAGHEIFTGYTVDREGQTIRLQSTKTPASYTGRSGAPVVVGEVLLGIIYASTVKVPKVADLLAISAQTIAAKFEQARREPPTVSSRQPESDEPADSSNDSKPPPPLDSDSLFRRLSPASLRALGHAEGIQRQMDSGKIHTEQLIAGLYQKEDGELRVLMKTAKLDGDSLFQILDTQARKKLPRLPEYKPVKLRALPSLSQHVSEALVNARDAADADKSELINNWQLLYGVLAVDDCDLTQKLNERGLVKEKVKRGPAPKRTIAHGTARPNIAGFSSDDPRKGTDHFGITRDVKALCSVLAAKSVEPPLSLGLFGDWGSGKSFFMGQMEKEFTHLKEVARDDKNSPYCPNIVQLWFNAWHYMDMDLWASLASEIFEQLAKEMAKDESLDVGETDPQTARARLVAATASKKDVLADAERRRSFAETELRASEERLTRLQVADKELADSLSPQTILRAAYRFVANQPEVRAKIEEAGKALNLSHAKRTATETKAELLELKGLWGRTKALYLAIRNARSYRVWFILLFCVLLVLVAIPLLLRYKDQIFPLLGGFTTFLVGLGGLWLAVRPYLKGVGDAFKIIDEARAATDDLIEQTRTKQRETLERQRTDVQEKLRDATQRVEEASAEVTQLERQLDNLRADRQMAVFIRERHESSDYINQLGTIARARNDFEKLSVLLAQVREQTLAEADSAVQTKGSQAEVGRDGAAANGKQAEKLLLPRIDRIILYIDDLDRCPEAKVVDVLQAVHLLLAFPLFVVVVGVDPRWLLHSLKQHSKVFQGEQENGEGASDEESRHWQSTPLNYLEKIFQIPFTLLPMAYEGFGEFIEDLAKPTEEPRPVANEGAGKANEKAPNQSVKTEPGHSEPMPTGGKPAPSVDAPPTSDISSSAPDTVKGSANESAPTTKQQDTGGATTDTTNVKTEGKGAGEVDLSPEHLRIEAWEREYMKSLFWLIPSPRAAKRFVNIYRLLRASVPQEQQAAFVGETSQGQHRVALLLLAIVTGYPTEAAEMLRGLLKQEESRMWWNFVDEIEEELSATSEGPGTTEPKLNKDNLPEKLSAAEAENVRQLFNNLREVRELIPDTQSCADFIYWAPRVARYSFQSGRVLLTRRDGENSEDG
jgi:hypothetical protein